MTAERFMNVMESYYGKYNPTKRAIILEYVKHDVNVDLQILAKHVLEDLDSRYKSTPDIATLKKSTRAIKKNDPNVYYNGKCLGHYDGSRFIPDLTSLSSNEITRYVSERAYSSKVEFMNFLKRIGDPALENHTKDPLQIKDDIER